MLNSWRVPSLKQTVQVQIRGCKMNFLLGPCLFSRCLLLDSGSAHHEPPKPMRKKRFGLLKTRLFTIKISKNVGFGEAMVYIHHITSSSKNGEKSLLHHLSSSSHAGAKPPSTGYRRNLTGLIHVDGRFRVASV